MKHIGDCCARPEDEVLPNTHTVRRQCLRCGRWGYGMLPRNYHDVGCRLARYSYRGRTLACDCI